jgi:hypothetical protein
LTSGEFSLRDFNHRNGQFFHFIYSRRRKKNLQVTTSLTPFPIYLKCTTEIQQLARMFFFFLETETGLSFALLAVHEVCEKERKSARSNFFKHNFFLECMHINRECPRDNKLRVWRNVNWNFSFFKSMNEIRRRRFFPVP